MSFFCLHRFALFTNPRTTPAENSRYRLIPTSVLLISRQPMKLQISFGFARAMPSTSPRTGMLWERDCYEYQTRFSFGTLVNWYKPEFQFGKISKDAKFGQYLYLCVPFIMNRTDAKNRLDIIFRLRLTYHDYCQGNWFWCNHPNW